LKVEPPKPPTRVEKSTVVIIKWSFGVIGVAMALLSAYYSQAWMAGFLPGILSWVFSGSIILFSIMSLEISILFGMEGKKALAWVFRVLFLMTVIFSVSAAMAGQYNKAIQSQQEQIQSSQGTRADKVLYDLQVNDRDRVMAVLQEKGTRGKQLLGIMDQSSGDTDSKAYKDARWELSTINKEVARLTAEHKGVQAQIEKLVRENPALLSTIQTTGFYDWIAETTSSTVGWVQFLMYLLPAIFIDLLAPVGVAIFLFLGSYNKAEEK
jgi:hypothetical protein